MNEDSIVKITNIAYQLLGFFPDNEPLKVKSKERVLLILENLTTGNNTKALIDNIEVLEKYLTIAKLQGWIDAVNFLILTKEYNTIKESFALPKKADKKNGEVVVTSPKKIVEESTEEDFNERQKKILQLLAQKEKAQVSGIIKELPNITKRTIRRDLDDLLKKGKIMRIGEWNQVFYQIK